MAAAQEPVATQKAADNFGPHEDSWMLFNRMDTRGWAGKDDSALRAHYSFKYTVAGTRYARRGQPSSVAPKEDWEFFLSYTGEFDFYVGSRPSDPVINRISNPAVNLRLPVRWLFPQRADRDDNVVLSVEHRSDGQTQDASTDRGVEQAQRAYDARDQRYFDALSRGSNFVGISVEGTTWEKQLEMQLKLRLHFSDDTRVAWGPWRDKPRRIRDYDLLQVAMSYRVPQAGWFDATLRTGLGGLRASSMELGYQIWSENLPLYLRYHRGPMNTVSNYSQRQDSFGIGLRFARPFAQHN